MVEYNLLCSAAAGGSINMLVETFGALVETLVQWWRHWCTGGDTVALADTSALVETLVH